MAKQTYDKVSHEANIFEKQEKRKKIKSFINKLVEEIPDEKLDNFIKDYEKE